MNMTLSFDRLYQTYYPSLLDIVERKITNHELAEDVLQDAFIKIWTSLPLYDPSKGGIYTWMARVCTNLAIDELRSKGFRNQKQTFDLEQYQLMDNRNYCSELNTDVTDVFQHVLTLEPRYRSVIFLTYQSGYTQTEIAKRLNLPLGTVKSRIRIGIASLRKIYQSG